MNTPLNHHTATGASNGMRGRAHAVGLMGLLLLMACPAQAVEGVEIAPRPMAVGMVLPVAPARGVPQVPQVAAQSAVVAVPVSVPDAAKPAAAVTQWEVKASDITLAKTIERWTNAAGYKLKWDASRNFLIGAPDVYTGSFEFALQSVLSSSGIRLSDYPLEACIYANTPPLVRITRQGEQARECGVATVDSPTNPPL